MKFNINDYNGEYAMHCKTKEEAKVFCCYLNSIGKKWRGNVSYSIYTTYWGRYKDQTCYDFNKGAYSDKSFYEDSDYTILEFSEFEWDEMTKPETKPAFKVGDRVRCIDGVTNQNATGKVGTVIAQEHPYISKYVLVEFDKNIDGHDGFNLTGVKGKVGHCWWTPEDNLISTLTQRESL